MRRKINLTNKEFERWLNTPLYTDDENSYEIVCDFGAKGKGCCFKITATRSDGISVTDISDVSNDGVISYILAGNMYGVEGELTIRVQILNDTTLLTEKIIHAEVKKGIEGTEKPSTQSPILDTLLKKVTKLETGKVDKKEGKELSTNDFTNEAKEKLAELENYDDTEIKKYLNNKADKDELNNKADKDELNLKLYGTTDVHILTDDDVWISGDILEAQKRPIIEYDVVIIPYGIRHIYPRQPDYNDETNEYYWSDGMFPIDIRAKKIICPNTLVNIFGSADVYGSDTHEIYIQGDFVLNEGVQIIDLVNYSGAYGSSDIGNITVPKTLKTFSVWNYYHDIVIPHKVDKISFWMAERFDGHLYVYNPYFDFSEFETGVANNASGDGVIHGYAGSTAEAFAKEHGYTFKNLGSSGSAAEINAIKETLERVVAIQNEMLGDRNTIDEEVE